MKNWIFGISIILLVGVSVYYYKNNKSREFNDEVLSLNVPKGFSISIFAKNLPGARVLAWDPKGRLVVSQTSEGKISAIQNSQTNTILSRLNKPHGIVFKNDKLYVAENDGVVIYDYDNINAKATNPQKIIDLPSGGGHFTRTLLITPDEKLLISVGSSCNVCHEENSHRAKILMADLDGKNIKEFARGLRNSVFMAIHPVDGGIWATEMGRDNLGDNLPPDEVNIIEQGKNYGWPNCFGKNIHDAEFDKNTYIRNPCMEPFETASHMDIPAHSAPLGLAFIPEEGWPEEYWFDLLVAYHGSWNRSEPTGYKIVRNGEDFITGWIKDGEVWGRPVDILVQPGGTAYISDDKAGMIYKISRNSEN